MMLGAAKGDEIELIVRGADRETAMAALVAMIEDGFGEP
jgi:phosphocarrier protein